jgi:hypothetical protein
MESISVRLLLSELAFAERSAALQYQLARASEIKDRLIDKKREGVEPDIIGLKAEIAVANLLALDFDRNRLGKDNGVDLWVPLGRQELAIQVKSSHSPKAQWLLGTPHAKHEWDITVFAKASSEPDVMTVVGWISLDKYKENLEQVDLGHGPGAAVHIKHLSSMATLWRFIQTRRYE